MHSFAGRSTYGRCSCHGVGHHHVPAGRSNSLLGMQILKELTELAKSVMDMSRRLNAIEMRMKAGNPISNVIVMDKEHDRIMEEMKTIRSTYSDHQTWREEDRNRFNELRERREELRKLLGIKH